MTYKTKHFISRVHNLFGNSYKVLTNYKNNRTKVIIKCMRCGYLWHVTPKQFFRLSSRQVRLRGCPKCAGTSKRKTTNEVKKELHNIYGNKYTIESKYSGNHVPMLIRCNQCHHLFKAPLEDLERPDRISRRLRGCPYCLNTYRHKGLSNQQYIHLVHKKYGYRYQILSKYKGSYHKIKVRCNCCGHIWTPDAHTLIDTNEQCPYCSHVMSRGESLTCKYLIANGMKPNSNRSCINMDGDFCWGCLDLPFLHGQHADVWIPRWNMIIEYDGRQHFYPVFRSNRMTMKQAMHNLHIIQNNDKKKNKLCKKANIHIIRIKDYSKNSKDSYKKHLINTVLNKKLAWYFNHDDKLESKFHGCKQLSLF